MKGTIFSFLIFNFIFSSPYYDDSSKVLLIQDELSYSDCFQTSSSLGKIDGSKIFTSNMNSVQDLMITTWHLFKGYNSISYPIMIIEDNDTLIFQLLYNIVDANIKYQFKQNGLQAIPLPSIGRGKWYFIKVKIILGKTVSSTYDNVGILMQSLNDDDLKFTQSFQSAEGYPTQFIKSTLFMQIGLYFSSKTLGSCSLIRYVLAYLIPQEWYDDNYSSYHHKNSMLTTYYTHYDLFYTQKNPSSLINLTDDQYYLSYPQIIDITPWTDAQYHSFTLPIIHIQDYGGVVIYLEMKVESDAETQLINLQFQFGSNISIKLNNATPRKFVSQCGDILEGSQDLWYQIVIIIKSEPSYNTDILINEGSNRGQVNCQHAITDYPILQIQLGIDENTPPFFFDNFRVYRGTYLTSANHCYLQVGTFVQHCLICEDHFFLSYQDNIICKPGSHSFKSSVLDWERELCDKLMVFSFQKQACVCLKPYYFNGLSCQPCPIYCDGCTKSNVCIDQDPMRDTEGVCKNRSFDDGYNCIPSTYIIPNKQNFIFEVPNTEQLSDYYQIPEWTQSNSSLFLQFSIGDLNTSSINQLVASVTSQETNIFSIFIIYDINFEQHKICFNSSNTLLGCFQVNPRLVWIGIWSNFSQAIISVSSQGQISYDRVNPNINQNIIQPIICVGICISNELKFLGQIKSKVTFIKDIPDPIDNMKDFFLLRGNPSELYFYFTNQQSSLSQNFDNIITQFPETKDYKLVIPTLIDPIYSYLLEGITLPKKDDSDNGKLNNINFGEELSISCNIQYENFIESHIFLSYKINNLLVEYFLINQNSQSIGVQICIEKNCKIPQNCFLNLNGSFLAIFSRNLDEGSPDTFFYEFDVICNYKRSQVTFYFNVPDSSYNKQNIIFPKSTSQSTFFLNSLRIFFGASFYFDYSSTDPCFIYYNISDMKCLKAKQGKTLYDGAIVDKENCYTFSSETQSVIYNWITDECMLSNRFLPRCQFVSIQVQQCTQCADQNANLNNCLECKNGYFKITMNDKCQGKYKIVKNVNNYYGIIFILSPTLRSSGGVEIDS